MRRGVEPAMLAELGITPDIERVYLTMLEFPDYDANDLAAAVGMSSLDIRKAIAQLSAARLVSVSQQHPDKWELLDPNIGLITLLESQQEELRRKQERLAGARVAVATALSRLNRGDSKEIGVERVLTAEAVRVRLKEISEACTTEVWSLNPGGSQTEAGMAAARPLTEETLAKGIDMRCIYLDSACNDDPTRQHLQWMADQGAHVRVTPSLPTRMIIVDRSTVVMPVDIEISAQGALIITEQGLVENSIALYTAFWKAAKPFGSAPRRRGNGLSEQEIHAIRFWAQGCTDSAVARKLGVSERTVRRISDKVTEKFGTTSRFQTGAWVVIEGIIDSGDLV